LNSPEHKSQKIIRFLIIILALILSIKGYSQGVDPNDLFFRYITVEDGLPNNKVNAISMDKYGFMWFGTNDGVCRFDGLNIKYYSQDNLTGNFARTAQVSVIKNVDNGKLLIGSYALFRYNYMTDKIEACDSVDGSNQTGRVFSIEESAKGDIWLACENGLFRYDWDRDSIFYYSLRSGREYSILSLISDNGNLWLGTRYDGILYYDINKKEVKRIREFHLSTETKDQVNTFYRARSGEIWAGTQDNGIFIFNAADSSVRHIFPDPRNQMSYRVRKIINDKNGNIWVGSRQGIFFRKAGTDSLALVRQVDPLPSTTRSNSIFDIFIDPHEMLWSGTFSFGVGYTDFRRKPFRLYNLADEETMFFAKNINCFTDCDNDNIWIGTEEGGLFKFNRTTRKFKEFKHEKGNPNSLFGENVKSLAREESGNLWIGYYNAGLDYMDVSTGKIKHYAAVSKSNPNSIASDLIRSLLLDENGNLWIGTDKGIDFLKKGSGTFVHFNLNFEILTIFKDRKNRIWAGSTGNGIYLFNKSSLKFESKYSQYFSTTVKAIYIDSENNLWVGTNKGLYHVDCQNDSLTYSGINQHLPSNAILDILEDNSGNLWVSTGAGLAKLRGAIKYPGSFKVLKFGSQDGLQGEQFREFASYKNKNGEFYFGGVQGFNIFTPDSIRTNIYIPNLAFINLKISGHNVEIGKKYDGIVVLEKALNETQRITLSYKHSPVVIEFAALHYSDPRNNQFRFRLDPLDKDWIIQKGNMNFISYSNLRHGDFTFILYGTNADENENPVPLKLEIKVIPPFWQTWWFDTLVILILIMSGISYFSYRVSKLNADKAELELKVNERTHELKETLEDVLDKQTRIEEQSRALNLQKEQLQTLNSTKDKFFSIIAHDLRSPFQSLIGLSDLLLQEVSKSEHDDLKMYSRMINESSHHIYDLVENLLSWSRTQRNKISFEPAEINLASIIEETIALFQPNLTEKNLSVEKHLTAARNGIADRNMIEFIVRNLISNAIKFTSLNGRIILYLTDKTNYLQAEISDTGIGISAENQQKLFMLDSNFSNEGTNGEKGTGLGLIICKEFIEKNNGRIWVESKPGIGSSFFFTIPVTGNQS
jgi:ligand-binding sensor domain-containing protein/signal transduction histidine kinase